MNKADLLMTGLRQAIAGKAGAKGILNAAGHAKDGKEKVEHFREQLKLVAKEPKPATTHPVNADAEVSVNPKMPQLDAASVLAELTAQVQPEPETKRKEKDDDSETAGSGDRAQSGQLQDWRGADAALNAMVSKLDRAHSSQPHSKDEVKTAAVSAADLPADDKMPDVADVVDAKVLNSIDAEAPTTERFTVATETADIKQVSAVKAVVREQETHFEPVQQVSTLQKIVDRMASELPAAVSTETAQGTDAAAQAPDLDKAVEARPVRMMTLELDPPNLGSVTVKMRLAGDAVEIQLTADRYETTQLLRQERGALTDAMQSAGYSFDIASIDHTRTPDSNLNNGQQQQHQGSSDQRSFSSSQGGSQTNDGASGRSSGDAQGGARQNRQDNHDQSPAQQDRRQDRSDGGVRSSTVYL